MHLLQHYLQALARHAGMKWDSDNNVETEQIVDAIIAAAQPEELTEHERAVQRMREASGDLKPGSPWTKGEKYITELRAGDERARERPLEENRRGEDQRTAEGGKAARLDDVIDPRD